jgi:hypothetical protein
MQVVAEQYLRNKWTSCIITQFMLLLILYSYHCTCKWLIQISSLSVSVLVNYSEVCFVLSFTMLNWDSEICTWAANISVWYWCKNKSYKSCKRSFHQVSWCLNSSFINDFLIGEMHSTGSSLNKKCCINQGKAWWNWNQIRIFTLQIPNMISSKGTGFNNSVEWLLS